MFILFLFLLARTFWVGHFKFFLIVIRTSSLAFECNSLISLLGILCLGSTQQCYKLVHRVSYKMTLTCRAVGNV